LSRQEGAGDIEAKIRDDDVIQTLGIVHDVSMVFGLLLPGYSLAQGLLRISMRYLFVRDLLPNLITTPLLNALQAPANTGLGIVTNPPDIQLPDINGTNTSVSFNLGNLSIQLNASDSAVDVVGIPNVSLSVPLEPVNNFIVGINNGNTNNPVTLALNTAETVSTVNQVINIFLSGLTNISASIGGGAEIADFLDNQFLPSITLAMSVQTCMFGSDFLGPFDLGSAGQLEAVTLQIPCNLINATQPGGLGSVIEEVVGLMVAGDSMIHMVVLAIAWPLLAIIVEMVFQSPGMSKHFVPKDEVPLPLQVPQSAMDTAVAAEKLRVAALRPNKQIILVRNLRRVYKRPNLLIPGFVGALFFIEVIIMLVQRSALYVILAVNIPLVILLFLTSRWWAHILFVRVKDATHAVRGVSWASNTGMVLGLLGVNGAGKTSTFEMMAGLRTPSEGEVYIMGLNVMRQVEACRRYIGYCPQFDRLIAHLTPTDHLYLFGRIKGLVDDQLHSVVQEKLTQMQLSMYRDRYAGTLSGGNKRKLSVANALIGEPPIIFLDEPSTGMDPFARRFMWKVIDDVAEQRKKSVVVLTTHSMEEAEALCSKITIQVDGQLRCFGSSQQVKSSYGAGYEVPVKFKAVSHEQRLKCLEELGTHGFHGNLADILQRVEVFRALDIDSNGYHEKLVRTLEDGAPFNHDALQVPCQVFIDWWILDTLVGSMLQFLRNSYGEALCLEHYGLSARFRLPKLQPSQLSGLFEALLNNKDLYLDDFSVCQSSLEMIFNGFAKMVGKPVPPQEGPGAIVEVAPGRKGSYGMLNAEDVLKASKAPVRL